MFRGLNMRSFLTDDIAYVTVALVLESRVGLFCLPYGLSCDIQILIDSFLSINPFYRLFSFFIAIR